MFCSNCGEKLPEGAKFCVNCGAPVKHVPDEKSTPAPKADHVHVYTQGIDQLGDAVSRGIDETAQSIMEDLTGSKRANQAPTSKATVADASQDATSANQFSQKKAATDQTPAAPTPAPVQDASQESSPKDWKDYLTPTNIEKYAAAALLLPLATLLVRIVLHLINITMLALYNLTWASRFFDFISNVSLFINFLIRALFIIAAAAGIGASGYTLFKDQAKQKTWGWVTLTASVLAFLNIIGQNHFWYNPSLSMTDAYFDGIFAPMRPVLLIFGIAVVLYGIDALSRVFIQGLGIEADFDFNRDYAAWQKFAKDYQAKQKAEQASERVGEQVGEQVGEDGESSAMPASYFDGTGLGLLGTYILWVILTVLSCGILFAWKYAAITRWQKSHMVIDQRRIKFNGSGASLFGTSFLCVFLSSITCGIFGFFTPFFFKKWDMNHTFYEDEKGAADSAFDGSILQYVGYEILQFVLLLITLGLAYPWTHTMILRWKTKHSIVNSDRLYYDGTALDLLGRWFIIFILTIITCGLYWPWGNCWIYRYVTAHTHVYGKVDVD